MPVHTGKGSRSYGTVLIDKGNPVARGSSKPVTRKFDVSHYELTGEIRYLDEAEGNEVSKNDNSHNRAGKMRAEVTTVEQIKKLGGVAGVARQYKVTYPTAHKHCQEIESREKPQENPAPVRSESAPSELVEVSEGNPKQEEYEAVVKELEAAKVENKFEDILSPISELLYRKNRDYGNSYDQLRAEFGKPAFIIRLADKFNRLKTLTKQEAQVKDESEIDTIKDIIGYCALELSFRSQEGE